MNKNFLILILAVLLVIIGAFYFTNHKKASAPIATPITKTDTSSQQKEICYYKQTVGAESTDDTFISVNYDANDKVHGIMNFIPGDRDSVVGTYTGIVEHNTGMEGYLTRLNVIYTAEGDGGTSKQQEILIIGANDIKQGFGPKDQDKNGVYQLKDIQHLTYENALPIVDCSTVPDRVKADYSKK